MSACVSASRLFLFYRGGGQEDYVSVPMNVGGKGDWVGTIPGDAVQGKAIQYYIEARDPAGTVVKNSGRTALSLPKVTIRADGARVRL